MPTLSIAATPSLTKETPSPTTSDPARDQTDPEPHTSNADHSHTLAHRAGLELPTGESAVLSEHDYGRITGLREEPDENTLTGGDCRQMDMQIQIVYTVTISDEVREEINRRTNKTGRATRGRRSASGTSTMAAPWTQTSPKPLRPLVSRTPMKARWSMPPGHSTVRKHRRRRCRDDSGPRAPHAMLRWHTSATCPPR